MDAAGELLADVAASLRPQLSTLSAALTQEMVGEVPGLAEGLLEELLAASVTANVRTALDVFEQGLERASIEAPPAAVEYAHRLAQRGVPISALLRAYRLGQAGFQQRMIRAVSERTRDPDTLVQASLLVSTVVFTYVDRISELVVSAYQGERDRWLRNRGAVRSARVMAVLAGGQVDLDEADRALGYRLRPTHRAVVAWLEDESPQPDRLNHLERVVARLAEHYRADGAPLVIAPDDATLWAWLPVPDGAGASSDDADLSGEERIWAAVGDPASGVEGFRLSHRQARQAQALALAADPSRRMRVTEFDRAGLVALMCGDLDAVRAWVVRALGALAVDDEPSARLRKTVRAFLAAGGSYTAAAQELILHKNTVMYRIRRAEEVRGRPLADGRLEVEVALLVADLLGARVLLPPPSRARPRR